LVTLAEVEAAITAKRLGWQAGDTPISAAVASPGRFGLRPANLEAQALQVATVTPDAFRPKRPVKIDWYELRRVSSIKSQGLCGACVAFAICAAMESSLAIAEDAKATLDLSEADLFFCGCGDCCESGWDFVPALERAGKGVGLEASLAYGVDAKCKAIPPALRVSNWQTALSAEDRRYAVARGPVIAGMRVFDDFRYYTGGIYEHATGDEVGLHAVCVIGYDDDASCWIAKNSWSEAWGEKGRFRIAYGQCGLDQELPFIGGRGRTYMTACWP
jgi:Papain family cysteine protease